MSDLTLATGYDPGYAVGRPGREGQHRALPGENSGWPQQAEIKLKRTLYVSQGSFQSIFP